MAEQKAKYEEIVDWVQGKIRKKELLEGFRLESENELTKIFGVSRQTVRHAISILENRGLVERRRGSGTFITIPNTKEENREKTMRVAVVTTYVNEYIFSPIMQEIEKVLSKAGYDMQVAFTNNSIEKEGFIFKSLLKNINVDGIIVEATKSALPNPNEAIYSKIMDQGIPIVFINSYYKNIDAPHVSMNDKLASKLATEHLLQCGHQKIGGIFKADDGQGPLRYEGYVEALQQAEIKVKGERIAWIDTEGLRNKKDYFPWILQRLKDCTACVCYNDEVANILVSQCLEHGIRVPEDFSIIGIDDSELAKFCEVPLTSVKNPIHKLGQVAGKSIIELIEGNEIEKVIELDPEVVIRNSVRIINTI